MTRFNEDFDAKSTTKQSFKGGPKSVVSLKSLVSKKSLTISNKPL